MPWVKARQEFPALTSATTTLWQTIIEELGHIDQRPGSRDAPQSVQLNAIREQNHLGKTPPMHRKSWKVLITEKQLLEACRNRPEGLLSACRPCGWVHALSVFLLEAHKGGILSTSPQGGTGSLSRSIGQQLERAGFLQHLPAVITEAAQQLADLQDPQLIAALLMAEAAGRQVAANMRASGLAGPGDKVCSAVTVNGSVSKLPIIHAHLDHLMAILQMLGCLWPRDELFARVLPPLLLPLVQLLVQLLQHVSVYVSQPPDDLEDSAMHIMSLLAQANAVAGCIVAPVAHDILSDEPRFARQQQHQQQQQRQRQELLQSPDASQAVCLLLIVTAYARMLHGHQGAGLPSGSSSSSSSSAASSSRRSATTKPPTSYSIASSGAPHNRSDTTSSSNNVSDSIGGLLAKSYVSNSGKREAVFRSSWDLACSRHHMLPAVHDELLEALGCNSKAVVLLAASAASPAAAGSFLGQAPALALVSDVYALFVRRKQGPLVAEAKVHGNYWLSDSLVAITRDPASSAALPSLPDLLAQQPKPRVQWSAAEQMMHLLLPSVLLLTAAETPSSSSFSAADYVASCSSAGRLGTFGLNTWKQLESLCLSSMMRQHVIWRSVQGVASDRPVSGGVSEQQNQALTKHQPSEQLAESVAHLQLVAMQVEEALHIGVKYILPKLLGMCQSGTNSSSSKHTVQDSSSFTNPPDAFLEVVKYICMCIDAAVTCVQFRITVASDWCAATGFIDPASEAAAAAAVSMAAADAASAAAVAAWSQRAIELGGMLECFLRMQAALPGGGRLAQENSMLGVHCGRHLAPGTVEWREGGLLQAALVAGPGSAQQAQLFGLLCSQLKFASKLAPENIGWLTDAVLAAALAAARILQDAAALNQQSASLPVGSAKDLLPWLVLFGRCCSIWAEQLQQGAVLQHPQGALSACLIHMPYGAELSTTLEVFAGSTNTVSVSCLSSCASWLSASSTSAQLKAAGYNTELLYSQLATAWKFAAAYENTRAATATAAESAAASAEGSSSSAAASSDVIQQQLVKQLQAVGAALSTLAISCACNNPTCSNVSGPSEAGLVKGSSSACGGCRVARYCCRDCQKEHWQQHKAVYKALAAARAGPARHAQQ